MTVKEKLQSIQLELKVHKGQMNKFGGYKFRSAEDILEAIKPYASKHKVLFQVTENFTTVGEHIAIESRAIIHDLETEDTLMSTGTAVIDFSVKGYQHPQRTGAASSYAKKYALGNLLLIDDTKDADAVNSHDKAKPVLDKSHPKYQASIKAVSEGKTTVDKIKQVYDLGEGVEDSLTKATLLTKLG